MADYKSALSLSYVKLFYTNVFSEIRSCEFVYLHIIAVVKKRW